MDNNEILELTKQRNNKYEVALIRRDCRLREDYKIIK